MCKVELSRLCTSGSVRKGGNKGIEKGFGNFEHVRFMLRYSKSRIGSPEVLANEGQRVSKGREGFGIPSGLTGGGRRDSGIETVSHQRNPREQAEEEWRGTGNGLV